MKRKLWRIVLIFLCLLLACGAAIVLWPGRAPFSRLFVQPAPKDSNFEVVAKSANIVIFMFEYEFTMTNGDRVAATELFSGAERQVLFQRRGTSLSIRLYSVPATYDGLERLANLSRGEVTLMVYRDGLVVFQQSTYLPFGSISAQLK